MKKNTLIPTIILCFIFNCHSQDIEWHKYFGGQNGEATTIIKTSDGGMLVGGDAREAHPEAVDYNGGADGFLVKLDNAGNIEWSRCYGTVDRFELIDKVIQTSDGGYALAGRASTGIGNDYNTWIAKVDSDGTLLWEQKHGGENADYADDIAELTGGDLVLVGHSMSSGGDIPSNYGYADYILLRYNGTTGDLLNSRNIGGTDPDRGYGIVPTSDGGYIVCGESQSENYNVTCHNSLICESSFWIVKLNSNDNILWSSCVSSINGGANYFNIAHDIQPTSDGNFIVAGRGRNGWGGNTNGKNDVWLVKIDPSGGIIWRKFYGGSDQDYGVAVKTTSDDGYIVVGYTTSEDIDIEVDNPNLGCWSAWIFKVDSAGDLEWEQRVGSGGCDRFNDVIELNENEFVAAGDVGQSNQDLVDSNGRGFWITKINFDTLSLEENELTDLQVYPNPADEKVTIISNELIEEIRLFDMIGNEVLTSKLGSINELDISKISSGVYFLNVRSGDRVSVRKLIIK